MGNSPRSKPARVGGSKMGGGACGQVIEYANGDIYQGEFIQGGRRSGSFYPSRRDQSSAHESAGAQQEMEEAMRLGVREGQGHFVAKDKANPRAFEYIGAWRENKRHGEGRCYYYNGDLYDGEWQRGGRHGKGSAFLASGERYVGMWEHNKRHGQGTLWGADGSKYVGMFYQDQKHGQGQVIYPDGSSAVEDW